MTISLSKRISDEFRGPDDRSRAHWEQVCSWFACALLLVACACWAAGCASSPRAGPAIPVAMARPPAQPTTPTRVAPPPPPLPSVPEQPVREELEQIIIPSIEFRNAPIEEVIEELNRLSREADPDGIGINMILMPDRSKQPGPPGHNRIGPSSSSPHINFLLREVALDEVLRITCDMATY